jgi:hypothetical protein
LNAPDQICGQCLNYNFDLCGYCIWSLSISAHGYIWVNSNETCYPECPVN